ncbi:transmembrane protease serine 9-like [Anopheles marshallii]|uniref:transmembrane protease serine 9-like n=1 Tax=Anopheles marshallii TaxID=1521116 RepID=UPI00237A77BA|nr:transmembrane protease serine 9-like [Anopheles marshallii]
MLDVLSFLLPSLVVLALGQQQVNQPCILPNGRAGQCIHLEHCTPIARLVNRKMIYPQEKHEIKAVFGACASDKNSSDTIVCCESPQLSAGIKTDVTTTTQCADHYKDVLPVRCGTIREFQLTNHILSDVEDVNNVHVWAVLLEIKKTDRCVGTLIQESFVLTAAHCVHNLTKESIRLFFGVSKISTLQQCLRDYECLERGAAEFIVHPDYKPPDRSNDIALIRLSQPINISGDIIPACLPLNYTFGESESDGTRVHSVGWGLNEKGELSDWKGIVLLNVKPQVECGNHLNSKFKRFPPSMIYSVMCTDGESEGQDVCQGDSGAPLLKFHGGIYFVVGVVNFGPRCSALTDFTISVRVSEYLDWILKNLNVLCCVMIRVRFSVFGVLTFLLPSLITLALGQQPVNQNCILPTGSPGRCVRLKQCTKIAVLWSRKTLYSSQINELTAVTRACDSDGNSSDPIVCCESPTLSPGRKTDVTATTRTTTAAPITQPTTISTATVRTQTTVNYEHYKDVLPEHCGTKQSQLVYNVISDAVDENNEHVWAVLLEIKKTDRCAGTLIQESFVLTAAHCVHNMSKESIRLFFGVSKISTLQQCLKDYECVERSAVEFIVHPNYIPHARTNDIALIWLNETVGFEHVVPACLPLNYTFGESESDGTRVHSVGWGLNEKGELSDSKGIVLLNVKPQVECGNHLNRKFKRFPPSMIYSVMCTFGESEGQDVCQGDSGAPLLRHHSGLYFVVGVVNFGPRCSALTDPTISVRVSEYLDWILTNLKRSKWM